ncbi:MAG: hypothetical protein R6V35_04520 [Candidatus Nanohaloarchaea archaeon]
MLKPELLRYRTPEYDSVLDARENFKESYEGSLGLDFDTAIGRYPPHLAAGGIQTVWTIEPDNLSASIGENLEDIGDRMLEATREDEIEARLKHNPAPLGGNDLTEQDVELMDLMYQTLGEPEPIRKENGLWSSGHFGRELIDKHYAETSIDL